MILGLLITRSLFYNSEQIYNDIPDSPDSGNLIEVLIYHSEIRFGMSYILLFLFGIYFLLIDIVIGVNRDNIWIGFDILGILTLLRIYQAKLKSVANNALLGIHMELGMH
jgi:hypothetical protein